MIDLRFVPLDIGAFPGGARLASKRRASSVFHSTYIQTLNRLESELKLLGAIDIVVQAGYAIGDLRNDGWPRSNAKPSHPAVVLAFRSKKSGEEYSFPCDTFTDFYHNLHAIVYTLESLRDVARYGVTRGHEQYKGFAQIAAPPDPKNWTADKAAEWLAERSGLTAREILQVESYYRQAYITVARTTHPDADPVQGEEWQRLQTAKALLDQVFRSATEAAP